MWFDGAWFGIRLPRARKLRVWDPDVREAGSLLGSVVMGWTPPDGIGVPKWRCR
jgi:hypothetical protein